MWSERILEEWRRAAARVGQDEIAQFEIDEVRRRFPAALAKARDETMNRLSLPDADDVHVFAAAVDGQADELLTLNVKDFPGRTLGREGLLLRHPDEFLLELHRSSSDIGIVVNEVLTTAGQHGIDVSNPRSVLKRARLPRLGKALYAS